MNLLGRFALILLCVSSCSSAQAAVSWNYVNQKLGQFNAWHNRTFNLPSYEEVAVMSDGEIQRLIDKQYKHVGLLGGVIVLSGLYTYASCSYIGAQAATDCVKKGLLRRFAGACATTTTKSLVTLTLPAPIVIIAVSANSIYHKMRLINYAKSILADRKTREENALAAARKQKQDQELKYQSDAMQKKIDEARKQLDAMQDWQKKTDDTLGQVLAGQQDIRASQQDMMQGMNNFARYQQDVNLRSARMMAHMAAQLEQQGASQRGQRYELDGGQQLAIEQEGEHRVEQRVSRPRSRLRA